MGALGKGLIALGLGIVILGLVFLVFSKLGMSKLPGDVVIHRRNLTIYAPVGLMVLVSLVLTLLLNLFARR